jgi:hypothetical protein
MSTLRSKLIRLAHQQPALRPHLLPILKKTAGSTEGVFVGDGWRLTWDPYEFRLEELPAKGKRKLRVSELRNPYFSTKFDAWMPINLIRHYGKISAMDSFDTIKDKILGAMTSEKVLADVRAHATPGYDPMRDLSGVKWYDDLVNYLSVVPENVEPITVYGKNFSVKAEWLEFKSYSPNSDFEQSDPHYTIIKSSSATAARKFYQMLTASPDALKGISWDDFDDWLKANKINYKYEHSVWH